MMLAALLLAALLGTVPRDLCVQDRCDCIEWNEFSDTHGKLIFSQFLFWCYDPAADRHYVQAWRLNRDRNQRPHYSHARRRWEVLWLDGVVLRRVSAPGYFRTATNFDRELRDRSSLPGNERRELSLPIGVEIHRTYRSVLQARQPN